MADPKGAIETGIYNALSAALGASPLVYNSTARVASLPYVVFQAAGGDDAQYHLKERGWIYRYQVLAVGTDRADSVGYASTIDGALVRGGVTVSGWDVVRVERAEPLDYVQTLEDGTWIFFVGGTYEIEVD